MFVFGPLWFVLIVLVIYYLVRRSPGMKIAQTALNLSNKRHLSVGFVDISLVPVKSPPNQSPR